MARELIARLKLDSQPKESPYHIDREHLAWLIANHLAAFTSDPALMRASTIEKRFLNPHLPGRTLLKLMFCDGSASIPANGKPVLTGLETLAARMDSIERTKRANVNLQKPLLDGHDIMRILNLTPGPHLKPLIESLRDAQLEGKIASPKEAEEFLRTLTAA
jgi:hypothetical protein